jgi:undecaprenyl pyrophosphate synthase
VTTTSPAFPRGPVPGHVAWVARQAVRSLCATPDREERALRALVDSALELGIGWLTVQDPSSGRALREHARELADRGVAVADTASRWPGHAPGPVDLVRVESPLLQVLLADACSGRRQVVGALRALADRGARPDDVHEATIGDALGVPDVDLLVLTGNDRRVPDLFVWQVAYSEIVVIDEPWPEVDAQQFHAAVMEYQRRDRRYGGLVAPR